MKLKNWLKNKNTFWQRAFLLALLVRLIPVLLSRGLGIGLDDMFQYDMLARSILAGDGFRWYAQPDLNLIQQYFTLDFANILYDPRGVVTAFRAPLYPAFLSVVYFFSGVGAGRFFTVRIVQAFLGAALIPLMYCIARRIFPQNEKIARWGAWTVAFYPMLVLFPLALATENLFILLLLSAALMLLKAAEKPSTRNFLLAGAFLGMAALTRSVILVFALLAVAWIWFALKQKRGALLTALAVALFIAPWMARNYLIFERPTIEVSMGYNLYMGYHPESKGTFQYGISLDLMPMLDDGLRDRLGTEQALSFIKENPGRVPQLMINKLGYFFGLERRALTYFYSNNLFGFIPQPLLLLLSFLLFSPLVFVAVSAAFGLAVMRWRKETVLLALVLVGYIGPHLLLLAEERFHMAMVPFLAIAAAKFWSGGWSALSARWAESRLGKVAVIVASLAVGLLLLNWGLELYYNWDVFALLLGPTGNQTYLPY